MRPIATLCALMANLNRDPKKVAEPYTARDFMETLEMGEFTEDEPAPVGLAAAMNAIAQSHNSSLT